jgi:hypothetical protein
LAIHPSGVIEEFRVALAVRLADQRLRLGGRDLTESLQALGRFKIDRRNPEGRGEEERPSPQARALIDGFKENRMGDRPFKV